MPKDLATLAAKFRNAERIVLQSNKSIHFADKPADKAVIRNTDGLRMRSSSDKVARMMRRNGDNFSDYHDADYSESPRDPAWKAGQAKYATARPNSPFKRAGRSAASVVIVRK